MGKYQYITYHADSLQHAFIHHRSTSLLTHLSSSIRLIAGSDDCAIRIFKDEDVLQEITEADQILHLASAMTRTAAGGCFAYALTNGTIGVYSASSVTATYQRIWRVKSKYQCTGLITFLTEAKEDFPKVGR